MPVPRAEVDCGQMRLEFHRVPHSIEQVPYLLSVGHLIARYINACELYVLVDVRCRVSAGGNRAKGVPSLEPYFFL